MGNKLKLNLSIHYCKQVCVTKSQTIHTTQANEIDVFTECNIDDGENITFKISEKNKNSI